jgi:ferrous iron transport protein B
MGDRSPLKHQIALVGNPNSGKTSLFNHLTGLRQKTGNFPGVTVEKTSGTLILPNETVLSVLDFPGTYSLYPSSLDERVLFDVLSNPSNPEYPDLIVYIADAMRLEQHLLLLAQIRDLGIPALLALNLVDSAANSGVVYHTGRLEQALDLPVIEINGRTGAGIPVLKQFLVQYYNHPEPAGKQPAKFEPTPNMQKVCDEIKLALPHIGNDFQALIHAHHVDSLSFLSKDQKSSIRKICESHHFSSLQAQYTEIMGRYQHIDRIISLARKSLDKSQRNPLTSKIDGWVTHAIGGPILFFTMLFFVFQAVFTWSTLPMEWIEMLFQYFGNQTRYALGEGWLSSLLSDGILAGLAGVLVFIPQIAILFLLVSLLEESGYMARAVFLFDRIMHKFGLNGRSLVAMVSGTACAIPAIMSTRTITNSKERLITILVTPFISCSARLPVYAILVALVVPNQFLWGIFSYQALVFIGLYVLGALAALLAAYVLKKVLNTGEPGFLMLELPDYQVPHWRNVILTVWSKVASFVREAGKIILVISIILWFLASFGPGNSMELAEDQAQKIALNQEMDESATRNLIAASRLEVSYAGKLGKVIEPVIKPLGFDWKIGIALITSFAAREVFVGTMATIYSMGSDDNEASIRERMAEEINPQTGGKRYNLGVSLSLLLFYVFAMQCVSTLAVVKKETGSWKWPLIQLGFMTGFAYLVSLITYQSFLFFG